MASLDRTIATALFLLATTPAVGRAADPAPVIAAERAFAADGRAMGWVAAFKKYTAPDGIMFAPDPVRTLDNMAKLGDSPRPALNWWPLWAGMASSGDLGFTTGPYTVNGAPSGQYFTVWVKQADGRWAWVFDGGPEVEAPAMAPPSTQPGVLAAGVSSTIPWTRVTLAEDGLAQNAISDTPGAYRALLAADARIAGMNKRVATGPDQIEDELKVRATRIAFQRRGGSASKAGDLAWTYGDAAWNGGRGHYVRIWRRDRAGWRIVWDQLLPVKT